MLTWGRKPVIRELFVTVRFFAMAGLTMFGITAMIVGPLFSLAETMSQHYMAGLPLGMFALWLASKLTPEIPETINMDGVSWDQDDDRRT